MIVLLGLLAAALRRTMGRFQDHPDLPLSL